jgi:hypothetical protein
MRNHHHPIQPHWHSVSRRFPEARDCLASFLAYESAEILAGVKPASLINLVDRDHHCGRNFYQLWKRFGTELLARSGLACRELIDRGDSLLLLIYAPLQLQRLLAQENVTVLLRRAGYSVPGSSATILAELEERIRQKDDFPHEIGIFLGYPLKDVVAFMGWIPLAFTCQGPWKIYGQPEKSLDLAACHRRCRERMVRKLARCCRPEECLSPSRKHFAFN